MATKIHCTGTGIAKKEHVGPKTRLQVVFFFFPHMFNRKKNPNLRIEHRRTITEEEYHSTNRYP